MNQGQENQNPFRPGAGHQPPYLAGRENEVEEFRDLLKQDEILKNAILTGLRGVGKTVLMDVKFKAAAQNEGWAWVGSDFSESSFLSEDNLCTRLITDLSVYTSSITFKRESDPFGFAPSKLAEGSLDYDFLDTFLNAQAGLTSDRLKATLKLAWDAAKNTGINGIVFAYDEAQVAQDRKDRDQYPLAVLLETFQSLQKQGVKILFLLTGLPTLFPSLVESRTYAERMFKVIEIGRLHYPDAKDAIKVPMVNAPWTFSSNAVDTIIKTSDGYPYFIQFICRETFDRLRALPEGEDLIIPIEPILQKLDSDFFAGRWDVLTDRQRDILFAASQLENSEDEFMVNEIVDSSKSSDRIKSFSSNDVSQILPRLIEKGLVYKNRHAKYSFAVPLLAKFINRRYASKESRQQKKLPFND